MQSARVMLRHQFKDLFKGILKLSLELANTAFQASLKDNDLAYLRVNSSFPGVTHQAQLHS